MFCLLHIRIYSFNNRGMQIIWWSWKNFFLAFPARENQQICSDEDP